MAKIISQIAKLEFDRHPIAGNMMAFITLEDGTRLEAFRQAGLGIWAGRFRSRMSRDEEREFDLYLDARCREANEEGL